MTKFLQNRTDAKQKPTFAEKFVNWLSNGDLQSVTKDSLSVEIKGSSVTVDLSSVIGNHALAEQVKAVK